MARRNAVRLGFFYRLLLFISSVVVAGASSPARATMVEPMSLETLADYAVQVIEGMVAEVRSFRENSPPRIISQVTWSPVAFLKGGPSTATTSFVLTVPGGEVDGWQMRIAGAPEFRPGERWLLFLLPEYRTFPTVGIWEGAFRIVEDSNGVRRVYSAGGAAIVGLDNEKGTMVRVSSEEATHAKSSCVGFDRVRPGSIVITADLEIQRQVTMPRAMSYAEFKETLAPVLAQSRAPGAAAPVGKAVVQVFTPTALKSADKHDLADSPPLIPRRPIDAVRANPRKVPEAP
jgi:hypothetical protein